MNGFPENVNQKNLIYTAITRASDLAILVGTKVELQATFSAKHLGKLTRFQSEK